MSNNDNGIGTLIKWLIILFTPIGWGWFILKIISTIFGDILDVSASIKENKDKKETKEEKKERKRKDVQLNYFFTRSRTGKKFIVDYEIIRYLKKYEDYTLNVEMIRKELKFLPIRYDEVSERLQELEKRKIIDSKVLNEKTVYKIREEKINYDKEVFDLSLKCGKQD